MFSSITHPGLDEMAESLHEPRNRVLAINTGFIIMLGIGPLLWAPLSETFGRKPVYMLCLTAFALVHLPMALSTTLPLLIVFRTLAGFFGSKLPRVRFLYHLTKH